MRVISIKTIKDFWENKDFKDSEQSLKSWYAEVRREKWKSPHCIKQKYKNASVIGENRIVFNIKGNKYRLVVTVKYDFKIVFIRFIGTHNKYDKIDAKKI